MSALAAQANPPAPGVPLTPNSFAAIRSRLDTLPRGERTIADFILHNPEDLLNLSITDLATRLRVSQATVIRFCKRLGYRGYHEFKILLARDIGRESPAIYPELSFKDNAETVLRKTLRLSVQALEDTLSTLHGAELERAGNAIAHASVVVLFGVGGSGGIAVVGQQRLLRIGIPAFACTDASTFVRIAAQLHAQNVALGITHSGSTVEIAEALGSARRRGAKTIALTNYNKSMVSRQADIMLLTGAAQTPLASEAGTSRIVQLAAIDALCACIILRKRGYPRRNGRGPSA
jgi:DNA-binding MurR/RpiR family transcriptional regulator